MKIPMILAASVLIAVPSTTVAQEMTASGDQVMTRLDLSVTGSTSRVPDVAIISAGVQTRADTAAQAMAENAARMAEILKALRKAGVDDKDMHTSSINLSPHYDYRSNQEPKLIGYNASNQLSVKFRDIEKAGPILDTLVTAGANQISGPSLTIDKPDEAVDEARADAVKKGRERAELYARALGMRVVRVVMVSEGSRQIVRPMPMMARAEAADAMMEPTAIIPGEQDVSVTLQMSFDLQ